MRFGENCKDEAQVRELLKTAGVDLSESPVTLLHRVSVRTRRCLERIPTLEDAIILACRPRLSTYRGVGLQVIDKVVNGDKVTWEDLPASVFEAATAAGAVSVSELRGLLSHPYMKLPLRLGKRSLTEIQENFGQLVTEGLSKYWGLEISTPDQLVTRILSEYTGRDLDILQNRILGVETLESCGERLGGLTRERVRQLEEIILEDLRRRYGELGLGLELKSALDSSGGILPCTSLGGKGCSSGGVARLVLRLGGWEGYRIWTGKDGEEFLTCLSEVEFAALRKRLRERIREIGEVTLDLESASRLACSEGLCTESVPELFSALSIGERAENGIEVHSSGLCYLVEAVMRNTSSSLSVEEVMKELKGKGVSGLKAKAVRISMQNSPVLHPVLHGYIHENNLPFSSSETKELISRAVPLIKGEPGPVGTQWLLDQLGEERIEAVTFKSLLGREEGIRSLARSHHVCWVDSYTEGSITLPVRLGGILQESLVPLTYEEIVSRLPEKTSFTDTTIHLNLIHGKRFSRVPGYRWVLKEDLGISPEDIPRLLKHFSDYFSSKPQRVFSEKELTEVASDFEIKPSKGLSVGESILSLLEPNKVIIGTRFLLHPRYKSFKELILSLMEELGGGPFPWSALHEVLVQDAPELPSSCVRGVMGNLVQKRLVTTKGGSGGVPSVYTLSS